MVASETLADFLVKITLVVTETVDSSSFKVTWAGQKPLGRTENQRTKSK